MATFVDQREDDENNENEEIATLDEISEEKQPQQEEQSDIPEKYQGKNLEDIVRMHQEAEKLLGRQSSEVGELRRTVDSFIQTQLTEKEQAHVSTDTEIDFFDDPTAAVKNAIDNHPKIKQAELLNEEFRKTTASSKLKATHPDFVEISDSLPFKEWVANSKFRAQLLKRADQGYDFDAADELLTAWKERQEVVNATKDTETKARKQSVKSASTGSTQGSAEAPSRKVYRRADIIKLMQTDPDRYMSLAQEIREAYSEGRVR
tara:strand:+ start:2446 stop:3231 length:786 start_codon:yes stop_codon:yes gene_type:complete